MQSRKWVTRASILTTGGENRSDLMVSQERPTGLEATRSTKGGEHEKLAVVRHGRRGGWFGGAVRHVPRGGGGLLPRDAHGRICLRCYHIQQPDPPSHP